MTEEEISMYQLILHNPFLLLNGVIIEETIFRFLPIFILAIFLDTFKSIAHLKYFFLFCVVITSSVLFGIAHGDAYNILLQGVSGLLFSVVYLKCGGMDQDKFLKPMTAVVSIHFLFNLTAINMTLN